MKITAFFCWFILTLHVQADTLITQAVEFQGRTKIMFFKIKGEKLMADISPKISILSDLSNGESVELIHSEKSFSKIPPSKPRNGSGPAQTGQGNTLSAKPTQVRTEKLIRQNNYQAVVYTVDTPTAKTTFWIVKDFPNAESVRAELKKVKDFIQAHLGPLASSIPDIDSIPGVPVKTQIISKGQTLILSLISAEEKTVNDSDMRIPAGYTEI